VNKILQFSLFAAILFAGVFTIFIWHEVSYPTAWDKIQPGMSREEVMRLVGPVGLGDGGASGKGTFVRNDNSLVWHEIEIVFTRDMVVSARVQEYLGEHHPIRSFSL
jgi:hypothetical protein